MPDYKNPDNIGNHFEVYGYEGWADLQDDPWGDIPEQDLPEERND